MWFPIIILAKTDIKVQWNEYKKACSKRVGRLSPLML